MLFNYSNYLNHLLGWLCLLSLLLCGSRSILAQSGSSTQKFTISGYVEDAATGEKLIGANVYIPSLDVGASTNNYGFYSLTVPSDSMYLSVSYVGYQTSNFELNLTKDVSLNFTLSEGTALETVEIIGEKAVKIEEKVQMSEVNVPIKQIQEFPAILGEVDVLKTLQLLPGVQSGTEGTSGLYVRGGSPDQNLILLDGVPMYNVSHLFGFFSVFNADAITNVSLIKGGYPARYGGRLSSVLDITLKEGNMKEFHGEGSISAIASKLTLEGPIIKDKASFMISARRTYLDVLYAPFIAAANASDQDFDLSLQLYFYDLNGKVNYKISDQDRLYFSVYNGKDRFGVKTDETFDGGRIQGEAGLDWGNTIAALRWNRVWNGKLFSNTTATYSRYGFRLGATSIYEEDGEREAYAGIYNSGIRDWTLKTDWDYIINPQHYIRAGANVTMHQFTPGATNFEIQEGGEDLLDTTLGTSQIYATEYLAYVEDEMTFGKFKANVGVHASAFGVGSKTYYSVQPRIGLLYKLPKDVALKASYAQMQQYINLLSNEGIGLPTDLWVPSTQNIAPQTSWQVALGVAKTIKDVEFSVEGYYKSMDNLVSYREGANFLFSFEDSWESQVTQGIGESYGVEFFAQKKEGKTTGWIGYTLSWSNRQFDEINGGRWYPFTYDRRHDISIVVAHEFNEKWSIAANWIYGTGRSITLPVAKYSALVPYFDGGWAYSVERAESKNAFRMSSYQRLDASVKYYRPYKRFDSWWIFSVYNAYNHLNPFFIQTGYDDTTGKEVFREYGLFPIIPSVAWKIKF